METDVWVLNWVSEANYILAVSGKTVNTKDNLSGLSE